MRAFNAKGSAAEAVTQPRDIAQTLEASRSGEPAPFWPWIAIAIAALAALGWTGFLAWTVVHLIIGWLAQIF